MLGKYTPKTIKMPRTTIVDSIELISSPKEHSISPSSSNTTASTSIEFYEATPNAQVRMDFFINLIDVKI